MNAGDVPLPHGPRARFIQRVLERSDDAVIAVASPSRFAEQFDLSMLVDVSEWTIEVLAQTAPLLLAPSSGGGVVAGIESLEIHRPLTAETSIVYLRLCRLSDRNSRFPRFQGAVAETRAMTHPIAEAEFTLSLSKPSVPDG